MLRANPDVPYDKRIEVARFIEDLTASLPGRLVFGDQPARRRLAGGDEAGDLAQLPVGSKVELVERLLERGVLHDETRAITRNRQPGRCCDTGCTPPGQAVMVPLPRKAP